MTYQLVQRGLFVRIGHHDTVILGAHVRLRLNNSAMTSVSVNRFQDQQKSNKVSTNNICIQTEGKKKRTSQEQNPIVSHLNTLPVTTTAVKDVLSRRVSTHKRNGFDRRVVTEEVDRWEGCGRQSRELEGDSVVHKETGKGVLLQILSV